MMESNYGRGILTGAVDRDYERVKVDQDACEAENQAVRELEERVHRTASLAQRAGYLAAQAAKIQGRVFGPQPKEVGAESAAPSPIGSLNGLDAGLSELQRQLDRISDSLDQLGRL